MNAHLYASLTQSPCHYYDRQRPEMNASHRWFLFKYKPKGAKQDRCFPTNDFQRMDLRPVKSSGQTSRRQNIRPK